MIPLRDTNRSLHFPVMNWLLLIANALVFFYEIGLSQDGLIRFTNAFALVPSRFNDLPVHYAITVFTSMFMHAGWFHFLSNMWVLFIFGDNVEDRMGQIPYLVFYLISGAAAALLQTFVFPDTSVPMLGASGAIAGVLGAYIFYYPGARVVTLVPIFFFISLIEVPALIFIGFWFVTQLFSGLASIGIQSGGVAWWAHIGGFLVGLVLSLPFMRRRPRRVEFF
jgi:membrane associated rhomboid family serine protease